MNRQSSNAARILGLVFFLVGLFAFGAGSYYGYESFQLVQHGRRTGGTVIDFYQEVSSEDQQLRYAPIIEYQADGETFRFVSADFANNPAYDIGEQLEVLYDTEHPDEARLDRFGALWGLPLGIGSVGFVIMLAGFGVFFKKD